MLDFERDMWLRTITLLSVFLQSYTGSNGLSVGWVVASQQKCAFLVKYTL